MGASPEAVESMLPRKAPKFIHSNPYRKPTQVGGMNNPSARENSGQGTRQNNPVTSEEGVLSRVTCLTYEAPGSRSELVVATVY